MPLRLNCHERGGCRARISAKRSLELPQVGESVQEEIEETHIGHVRCWRWNGWWLKGFPWWFGCCQNGNGKFGGPSHARLKFGESTSALG
jgi:hypothetical protein